MTKIKKIILVDDDETFSFLTTREIESTEQVEEIQLFENGLDALEFFKDNENNEAVLPEILLIDLSMPILDGWQFVEEYAKLQLHHKVKMNIYLCSSSISPSDLEKAKQYPLVTDYLIKPLFGEKIRSIIDNY